MVDCVIYRWGGLYLTEPLIRLAGLVGSMRLKIHATCSCNLVLMHLSGREMPENSLGVIPSVRWQVGKRPW